MQNNILIQKLIHAKNPFETLEDFRHLSKDECDYVIKERFRLHDEARSQKILKSKKSNGPA